MSVSLRRGVVRMLSILASFSWPEKCVGEGLFLVGCELCSLRLALVLWILGYEVR